MAFRYNHEKNIILNTLRGIGFEEIILEINKGNLLDSVKHHNQQKYPGQKIMFVRVVDTVYMVPYIVESDGTIFLKTLYPSRKATKKFLRKRSVGSV